MIALQFFIRSLHMMQRSFMSWLMMFVSPVVFFLLFGVLIDADFDLSDIKVAVDASTVNVALIRNLEALDGIEVSPRTTLDDESILSEMEAGRFHAYIRGDGGANIAFIDSAFERTLSLVLKAARLPAGQEGGAASVSAEMISVERVDVESAYVRYVITGLFSMALIQLMIYGVAMPILTERAAGTWRLFWMLPVSPVQILFGEGISRLIVAGLQMLLLYTLTVAFIDITLTHDLLPFVLTSLISSIMCITVGIAVGGWLPDERWGIHLLNALSLFMFFLGNIFFPMHEVAGLKMLVLANPMVYSTEAIRWALTGTPGFIPPTICLGIMIAWTLAGLLVMKLTFRYETVTTV